MSDGKVAENMRVTLSLDMVLWWTHWSICLLKPMSNILSAWEYKMVVNTKYLIIE